MSAPVLEVPVGRHDLGVLDGRGPVCEQLADVLAGPPRTVTPTSALRGIGGDDPVTDEDLQAALYALYELHHGGITGVDAGWEWEPSLLDIRRRLEDRFESWLRDAVPVEPVDATRIGEALWDLTRQPGGRSLSGWVAEHGDLRHAVELAVHRAAYQLKEADPHTFAMVHTAGGALQAMTTIQYDEYGDGDDAERHAQLYVDSLMGLGLDAGYGSYLRHIPGVTLATNNLFCLLSLHRRLRGAVIGHLAGFEMNSVGPMSRYADWHRRLGFGDDVARFYDVHVVADESHQHIAADELAGNFALDEPDEAPMVIWGARVLGVVEGRFAAHVLDCWQAGRTSLRWPAS